MNEDEEFFSDDLSWMTEDYLELEECDTPGCLKKVYSTCRISCTRCGISNELMLNTIYHCLDCIGQDKKYEQKNNWHKGYKYNWNHGFDICQKCYNEDPTFEKNHHLKTHTLQKIDRQEMIHNCSVCNRYFCHDCRVTSNKPIIITTTVIFPDGEGEEKAEEWIKSICKECVTCFTSVE